MRSKFTHALTLLNPYPIPRDYLGISPCTANISHSALRGVKDGSTGTRLVSPHTQTMRGSRVCVCESEREKQRDTQTELNSDKQKVRNKLLVLIHPVKSHNALQYFIDDHP